MPLGGERTRRAKTRVTIGRHRSEHLSASSITGESWATLGVPDLFGRARVVSTDPSKSNSGFMFAGLAANLLSGDVVTLETLGRVEGDVGTIFKRMGFKPSSSGKLFDDYIAGGAAAQPLVVGYENQLVEWVMQDPERWKRLEAAAPAKPVMLYPRPTVFSAHPLISLTRDADELIDALMNEACSNWPGKIMVFADPSAPSARPKVHCCTRECSTRSTLCCRYPRRPR